MKSNRSIYFDKVSSGNLGYSLLQLNYTSNSKSETFHDIYMKHVSLEAKYIKDINMSGSNIKKTISIKSFSFIQSQIEVQTHFFFNNNMFLYNYIERFVLTGIFCPYIIYHVWRNHHYRLPLETGLIGSSKIRTRDLSVLSLTRCHLSHRASISSNIFSTSSKLQGPIHFLHLRAA